MRFEVEALKEIQGSYSDRPLDHKKGDKIELSSATTIMIYCLKN